jgi:hypothetical protein
MSAKVSANDDRETGGVLPPPATLNAETEPLIGSSSGADGDDNDDDDVPTAATAAMLKPEHRRGDRTAKTAALVRLYRIRYPSLGRVI